MKLTLSKEKTLITDIRKRHVKFLGYEFKMVPGKSRRGYIPRTKPDKDRLKRKVDEIAENIKKIPHNYSREQMIGAINRLNSQTRGIPDGKGGWKNHRENATDWNNRENAEKWRAAWAAYANRALEAAGRPERIDHRSYKRQGVEKIPSIHMGPAASQMERRGITTEKGNINRQIAADNKLLKEIKARITRLYNWTKEQTEIEPSQDSGSLVARLYEAQAQVKAWQKILCKRYSTKSRMALRKQSGIWRTSPS